MSGRLNKENKYLMKGDGLSLWNAIEAKPITHSKFAEKAGIAESTLYTWFNKEVLKPKARKAAVHVLNRKEEDIFGEISKNSPTAKVPLYRDDENRDVPELPEDEKGWDAFINHFTTNEAAIQKLASALLTEMLKRLGDKQ